MFSENASQDKKFDRKLNIAFDNFCIFAKAESIPLEKQGKFVESTINLLKLFQQFEGDGIKDKLIQSQKQKLSDGQTAKNPFMIKAAIGMNEIINNLNKGRDNKDAQTFYAKIEETIELLEKRQEKIITVLTQQNNQVNPDSSIYISSNRFGLSNSSSTNPPPTKRQRLEEQLERTEDKKQNNDYINAPKTQSKNEQPLEITYT